MPVTKLLGGYAWLVNKRPLLLAIFFTIMSLFFYYHIQDLSIETDMATFIDQEMPVIKSIRAVGNRFGSQDMLIIFIERDSDVDASGNIMDMRDPQVLAFQKRVEERLRDMKEFTGFDYAAVNFERRIGSIPGTYENSLFWHGQFDDLNRYYNKDYSKTAVYCFGSINMDPKFLEGFEADVYERLGFASPPVGLKLTITGQPTMMKAMVEILLGGLAESTAYSFTFVYILLYLYFRSFILALLPLIPIFFAVIWTGGTMVLTGVPLSTITAGISAMLIGIGIDYGIHVVHRYIEEREEGKPIVEALDETYEKLGFAVLVTALTTVVGFWGLLFASMPAIQQLGLVMGMGVAFCMVASLFFLPVLLVLAEKMKKLDLGQQVRLTFLDEPFKKIGLFVESYPVYVLVVLMIITGFFAMQAKNVRMEEGNQMPEEIEVVKVMERFNKEFGGSNSFFVLIEKNSEDGAPKNLLNHDIITKAHQLAEMTKSEKYVEGVTDPFDELPGNELPADEGEYQDLLNTRFASFFSRDQDLMLIKVSTSLDNDQPREKELVDTVARNADLVNFPSYVDVKFTGGPVIGIEIGKIIGREMAITTLYGLIGVMVIVSLTYGSLALAFTCLLPLIISLIWTYGSLAILDIELSTNTSSVFSMILGLGIDFAIHLNHRFKELLPEMPSAEAMAETYRSVGAAITVTTATTIAGFFAMTIGDNPFMDQLGAMLSIGVLSCLIASLMLVPPVIIIEEKIIAYVKGNILCRIKKDVACPSFKEA